jgi:hypothetical protein
VEDTILLVLLVLVLVGIGIVLATSPFFSPNVVWGQAYRGL